MKLDHFDKLEHNVDKIVKRMLDLKAENNKLKKEVEYLRKQKARSSERLENQNKTKIVNTGREKFPLDKTDTLVSQLDEVIKKMKSFTRGVEF